MRQLIILQNRVQHYNSGYYRTERALYIKYGTVYSVCLWVGVITPVCVFSTVCLLQCRSCCLTVFSGRRTRDFHRDLCVSSYWCVRNIIACFLHCYLQALFIDKWLQRGLNRSDSTETLICPHSLPFSPFQFVTLSCFIFLTQCVTDSTLYIL